MKRNLLALGAIVLAVSLSAFKTFDDAGNFYQYTGAQNATARKVAANYMLVPDDPGCSGTDLECAMYLNQTTTTPVFSGGNVTFDVNGYPNGGSTLLGNENLQ